MSAGSSVPDAGRVLHVLRDGALRGGENMARDEYLFETGVLRPAVLRIYAWSPPTISLGYFQRYGDLSRLPRELQELDVVRRVTGGGAILHDREITYCLVLDETVAATAQAPTVLYRLAHDCWRRALSDELPESVLAPESFPLPTPRTGPFFCFQKPGQTDLVVGSEKLLGSAQRRRRDRVLQHGSLLLGRRFRGHPGVDLGDPSAELVEKWTERFIRGMSEALGLVVRPAEWTDAQLAEVERRRVRCVDPEWVQKR